MADIYEQHDKAFADVQAFVVMKKGKMERVATIAFKVPKNEVGRLYCYFHIFNTSMVKAHAVGYGYDKKSEAVHNAVALINTDNLEDFPETAENIKIIKQVLLKNSGSTWDIELMKAGFEVFQAV